ncbi:MAG: hypothetical protein ACTSSG_10615 [Candidatus Heimdallarchaeaceae archaeon]
MYKTKQTLFTLIFLAMLGFSFSTMFGLAYDSNNLDFLNNQTSTTSLAPPSFRDTMITGFSDFNYGLNATALVNRTISIEQFGVVSIMDNIKFEVIGNENITYFNYTLPNINTDKIVFSSFRIANNSLESLEFENATRTYFFKKMINYTTFIVPINKDLSSISQGAIYYFSAYIELARPLTYSIVDNEQLLHFNELIYPLINNIPIVNSTTRVNKQGNDKFIDTDEYQVTPRNESGITFVTQAEQDSLKWSNISRQPFNYSQSYSDDLLMNVYISSVSTSEAVEEAANTILFKASYINRRVEIDPYGLIKVTETQTLVFLGPEKPDDLSLTEVKLYALNAFPLILPKNTTILRLYDDMGALNLPYRINENGYFDRKAFNIRDSKYPNHPAIVIFPRSPLFHGDEFTFTIVYKVPMKSFVSKDENSINYRLQLSPSSILNWTIDKLDVEIVLPKGAVVRSFNYTDPDPYQLYTIDYRKEFQFPSFGFKRIFKFTATDFSGSDNAQIKLYYSYSRLNIIITYFFQVLAVGIIFSLYLGLRWLSAKTKVISTYDKDKEKEFIPIDEIEEFVKKYEEILSIRERLRETKAKIAAKKIKAKQGKDLIAKLEKRIRSEEESLKKVKESLIQFGGRYKDAVQKIEISERKLYEERRNLRALQNEYRVKKSMTKESYIKLFRERQQTIEKLKNEIDSVLVNLRMLIEP